jgi:sec-independent protein translocase protein TatB
MLDNFGLSEFLLLATLALLFFGPHRLPAMAGQLGRWLRKLTDYSKSFMNQWSEEAMAVQDAVAEVKGLRDEIRAAQAEIRSTLDTARGDIDGAISDAKNQIREAQPNASAMLDGPPPPQPAATATTAGAVAASTPRASDDVAIDKTQQVLDDLARLQDGSPTGEAIGEDSVAETTDSVPSLPSGSPETEVVADETQGVDGAAQDEAEVPAEATAAIEEQVDQAEEAAEVEEKESAFDRTQQILDQLLGKSPPSEGPEAERVIAEGGEDGEASAKELPAEAAGGGSLAAASLYQVTEPQASQEAQDEAKEVKESAFDKTQQILDQLMGREAPPEPEPVSEPEAKAVAEAQEPQASQPAAVEAVEEKPSPAPDIDLRSQPGAIAGPESGITYSKFYTLSVQVTLLQRELEDLKKEIRALRTEGAVIPAGASDEASSEAVAVEEVA